MPHLIFLSYAHDDNRVPSDEFTGWVDFFDRTLSIELLERALDCELWRDRRDLDPMAFFDDEILNAVRKSEILVAVISPRYVERNYCLRELAIFVESHSNGAVDLGAQPILKVVKRYLPDERQPTEIQGKTGVAFFRIDQEQGEEVPFYEGFGNYQDLEYWRVIRRIGASIENQLTSTPEPAPAVPAKAETLYLAMTSSDLAGKWYDLREEFKSNGYRVIPDQHALPTEAGEATRAIEAGLDDACLSVHLIGETAGFKPDGADAPIVQKQFEIAARRQAENPRLKRLVWLPKSVRSEKPKHDAFIAKLRQYTELTDGDEVLNGDSFEDLKTVVLSELRRQATHGEPQPDRTSAPRRVYLIYAEEDEEEALQVYEILAEAGSEILLPDFAAGEQERQAYHEGQLRACDGALIYFGKASQVFIRQQLDALEDRLPAGRTKPLAATGLYLGPPVTARKKVFRTQLVNTVIQGFDGPSGDALAPFLDRLAKGPGKEP